MESCTCRTRALSELTWAPESHEMISKAVTKSRWPAFAPPGPEGGQASSWLLTQSPRGPAARRLFHTPLMSGETEALKRG